mgnify:CR=1 FL=1
MQTRASLALTKIAGSLKFQTLITVTSTTQLAVLATLPTLDGVIVSNRLLEDFSYDMTGQQALDLLKSSELEILKEKHANLLILAEGRLGIIGAEKEGARTYLQQLKDAGAHGGIMGGGLAVDGMSLAKAQLLADSL